MSAFSWHVGKRSKDYIRVNKADNGVSIELISLKGNQKTVIPFDVFKKIKELDWIKDI